MLDFLPAGLVEDEEGKEQSVVRSADWRCMGGPWVEGDPSGTPDLAAVPRRTLRSKKEVYEVEAPSAKPGDNLGNWRQTP